MLHLGILNNITALKNHPVDTDTMIFVVGKETIGDNLGGFYRWDSASTSPEEMGYANIIVSNKIATGRWLRVFQKVKNYSHGILLNNGGIKTFYATGTTNANGEVTLNLTEENTAGGTPLFKEVWFNDSKSTMTATGPGDAVTSYVKSLSSNLKVTTHGYFKANALTITLGLLLAPLASVGAGINVQFRIEGI